MNNEARLDEAPATQEQPSTGGLSDGAASKGPSVVAVGDESADSWDQYVNLHRESELYHRYAWRKVIERVFSHRCFYLMVRDGSGVTRGVLPLSQLKSLLFGNFVVSLPYFNYGGILADSPEYSAALLRHAIDLSARAGASHIELRHRFGRSFDLPAREEKVSMVLDLPGTEDQLWSAFPGKLRSQVRRPTKAGATCAKGGAELLNDFYYVFSRNMRDLGTPVYPKSFFEHICDRFADDVTIFVVYVEKEAVAAGFTIAHRQSIEIPWASSLRRANPLGVNMLLYWSALRHSISRGYKRFDFGRSTIDSGTYRFKKQWGAEQQPLTWHYWLSDGNSLPQLNPENPKYRAAIAVWRRLPLSMANRLGPPIVRNLP